MRKLHERCEKNNSAPSLGTKKNSGHPLEPYKPILLGLIMQGAQSATYLMFKNCPLTDQVMGLQIYKCSNAVTLDHHVIVVNPLQFGAKK